MGIIKFLENNEYEGTVCTDIIFLKFISSSLATVLNSVFKTVVSRHLKDPEELICKMAYF